MTREEVSANACMAIALFQSHLREVEHEFQHGWCEGWSINRAILVKEGPKLITALDAFYALPVTHPEGVGSCDD